MFVAVVVVQVELVVIVSVPTISVVVVTIVLSVSTIVELVVVMLVVDHVIELTGPEGVVKLVDIVPGEAATSVEYEADTAEVIVDTVVVVAGPSGCLNRPIFPEPSSVNHTFRGFV